MKIETCHKTVEKKILKINYPCFRKSVNTNLVVLFFEQCVGVVVQGTYEQPIAKFSSSWVDEKFGEPLENYSATFTSEP
jgi:hypothetical protein